MVQTGNDKNTVFSFCSECAVFFLLFWGGGGGGLGGKTGTLTEWKGRIKGTRSRYFELSSAFCKIHFLVKSRFTVRICLRCFISQICRLFSRRFLSSLNPGTTFSRIVVKLGYVKIKKCNMICHKQRNLLTSSENYKEKSNIQSG